MSAAASTSMQDQSIILGDIQFLLKTTLGTGQVRSGDCCHILFLLIGRVEDLCILLLYENVTIRPVPNRYDAISVNQLIYSDQGAQSLDQAPNREDYSIDSSARRRSS